MQSWKTTVCGLALAAIQAVQATQSHDWKDWAKAAGIGVLGFLMKDFNVSGLTKS